jgi:phosphoribosylanthranilate isomerase
MKHERMTQVKICGLTNLEDALLAVEAGADLLGFIFYDASPRYVAPEVVRQIIQEIRDGRLDNAQDASHLKTKPPWGTPHASLQFVGVFVNASPETIAHTLDFCGLDAAQLHGDEPPEYLAHLAGRAYKALRPSSPQEAETLLQKYLP